MAGATVETKESQGHVELCVSENIRDLVNVRCLFHYFLSIQKLKPQTRLKGMCRELTTAGFSTI